MTLRIQCLALLATALLATSPFAQTNFPEVEPNNVKAEANAVMGITAGSTITGTTTGLGSTAGDTQLTSGDVFRVKTGALPLGIYRHRLTLTTSTASGHTGSIRGLNQTGAIGTLSTGGTAGTLDSTVQTSSATTVNPPPRSVQWYGFGKQEDLYYRVNGTTATTSAYTATMSTSTIAATNIASPIAAGVIMITSVGQATQDTEIKVYDGNLDAIAGFDNDDEGPGGPTLQSRLIRTFAPGTYFIAIGRSNTAWNIPFPPDEDFPSLIMDFQGSLVCSSLMPTTIGDNRSFAISGCNGTVIQNNFVPNPDSFSIQWFRMTVMAGAPAIVTPAPVNDDCAFAIPLGTAGGTFWGATTFATHDGLAGCDPGGLGSRDVWYTFDNVFPGVRLLSVNTCGTSGIDTAVSIHTSCADAVGAACNDNCGGAPCGASSSCTSLLVNPGQVVSVRVSDKGLSSCGFFRLTATVTVPPPPNDDCTTPIAIAPGVTAFDNLGATTGAQGQAEALCLNGASTAINKDLWYLFTPTQNATVTVTTCGLLGLSPDQDSRIAVYAGSACPLSGTAIACDDDDLGCGASSLNSTLTFPAVCGTQYLIQVGAFAVTGNVAGSFSVTELAGPPCNVGTPECSGDTAAACPCSGAGGSGIPNPGAAGNGCANSSFAAGAKLTAMGYALDNGGDSLVLTCSNMPGPGLFIQSNALAGPFVNFNDGILCAAAGIIRMGVVFPTAGMASYPGGLTPNPIHVAGAPVLLGGSPTPETKHYQCWYRDITVGFCNALGHNMSNGLAVVWAP